MLQPSRGVKACIDRAHRFCSNILSSSWKQWANGLIIIIDQYRPDLPCRQVISRPDQATRSEQCQPLPQLFVLYMFIHSFYTAYSILLLLRAVHRLPTATQLEMFRHLKLLKVPTQWLVCESNQRPFRRKLMTIPLGLHRPSRYSGLYVTLWSSQVSICTCTCVSWAKKSSDVGKNALRSLYRPIGLPSTLCLMLYSTINIKFVTALCGSE
jgi:hypothetical protein